MSFGKNIIWNTVGSLIYLACNWLTTVLVVTLSDNYNASGQLAIAMAVGNIFSTIMLFRVRAVQISDSNSLFSSSEYIGFRFASFVVASIFCSVYSIITVEPINLPVVFAYALFKAIESFADVFHGIDQKEGRFDLIAMSQILRGVALLLSFILGLALFDSLFISIVLMAISSFSLVMLFDVSNTSKLDTVRPVFSISVTRKLVRICTPGFLGMLTCTLVISMVRQSFGNQFGSDQLGIYAAVAAPTVIAQALASYVYAPMVVPISTLWQNKRTDIIISMIMKFTGILIIIVVLCIIGNLLIGKQVYSLIFGSSIIRYLYLLNPLLICTGMTALLYFLQDLLIVFRLYYEVIASGLIATVVAAATKDWFFSIAEMNGITLTILFAYCISVLTMYVFIFLAMRRVQAG